MRASEPQCQLIGFAAGVNEETNPQLRRKRCSQMRGVSIDQIVQIASVGVELRDLLLCCSHDARVAVSNMCDVVVSVEILPTIIAIEILHGPAYDFERTLIGHAQVSG